MTALDTYLAELDASLDGPRRRKSDLLHEAYGHLIDATEAYEAGGLHREEAERRAVREFGDMATVAPGYQAILSVDRSRRLAIWLFFVVLVQPFAWGGWNASGDNMSNGVVADRLDDFVELTGLVAMVLAILAVLGCGVAIRVLGIREWLLRLALTSALVSSALIVLVSVAMFVVSGDVSVAAIGFIATVVWVPLSLIAGACTLALRAVDGASDLGSGNTAC